MTGRIAIVDYGLGNLHSVGKAFAYAGAEVSFVSTPEEVRDAGRLVLPGVGAFADGMRGLREHGLDGAVREHVHAGNPLIGICLGMQLLMDESHEFGTHAGLGLVRGAVVPVPPGEVRVPHVGWGALHAPETGRWEGTVLESTAEGDWTYFVHSLHVVPEREEHVLAATRYGPHTLVAAIHDGPVTGLQFHPEKSGPAGLRILQSFCEQ